MIPRLGDGNLFTAFNVSDVFADLEIDSPSRGRKLQTVYNQITYHNLEIDSPSRGRKLRRLEWMDKGDI